MIMVKKLLLNDFTNICDNVLETLNANVDVIIDEKSREEEAYACLIDNKPTIVISAKLIFKIKDMDIMRAIICHELAHIYLHHTGNWGGDMIHSFQHELYADITAMKFLYELGYGCDIYIQMLKTLLKVFGERKSLTHPTLKNRIDFCNIEKKNYSNSLRIIKH